MAPLRAIAALVTENRSLGSGYFVLTLSGCEELADSLPGQFVMLRGDWQRDPLLPRAFSLLSVGPAGRATVLAKTVGRGTALLERTAPGSPVSVLGPLGTSFPAPSPGFLDLLVGGGVGVPPIYMQAEMASKRGLSRYAEVFYGGRAQRDLVLLPELRDLGVRLHLTTDDGTMGRKGLVTAELEARLAALGVAGTGRGASGARAHTELGVRIMACGPNQMLWAVGRLARDRGVACFLSIEEQMACGIGVCLGCAVPARSRPFRYVCKDGPVFDASDVLDVAPDAGHGSFATPASECPS